MGKGFEHGKAFSGAEGIWKVDFQGLSPIPRNKEYSNVLFLVALIVSFVVVRIGAIAFQLTGLEWSLAKFHALSCFTGTGFTTHESELIVDHPVEGKSRIF